MEQTACFLNIAVRRVLSRPLLVIATYTGSLLFLWVVEKGKEDFNVKNRGFCDRCGAGDAPDPEKGGWKKVEKTPLYARTFGWAAVVAGEGIWAASCGVV